MSFLGLGATPDHEDDSSTSVIHQDSDDDHDDDPIHDDDVDIGFRRHQYETFDDDEANNNRKRRRQNKSRQESKDEALYGVFYEEGARKRGRTTTTSTNTTSGTPGGAPMFVAASRPETPSVPADTSDPPLFVSSTKSDITTTTAVKEPPAPVAPEAIQQSEGNDDPKPPPPPLPADDSQAETEEEKEAEEKQNVADAYFQALLQQAQDKQRRRRREDPAEPPNVNSNANTFTETTMGNSMSSMLPQGFGRQRMGMPPPSGEEAVVGVATKKDPGIAKWEKHEKGIGSKLLFKMGWKGSGGLGSNRRKMQSSATIPTTGDAAAAVIPTPTATTAAIPQPSANADETVKVKKGISRPVEVVVRPANQGLGFGNFKEQSQLKSNRQIEAEVRGIELPKTKKKKGVLDVLEEKDFDDDDDDDDDLGPSKASASSSMPTTQELMTQKAWKRRKTKRQAPKIIPYKELVAQHEKQSGALGQPIIIDMRGPSSSTAGTGGAITKDGKVPLGEELLHNVTFMLNTHENQLHSYSQIIKSTERKEGSLKSEIADLKRQQQEAHDRRKKLESALLVVEKVEDLAKQPLIGGKELDQVIQWVQELGESFTAEDREALKFWQALAPAMLSPILQAKLEGWDPLGPIERTKKLLDSLFYIRLNDGPGIPGSQDQRALKELRYSILQGQLLPRVKHVLESSRWDPSAETEVVLDMYEYLQSLSAKPKSVCGDDATYPEDQILSGTPPDEDHAEKSPVDDLVEVFRKELVLETIYPKLQTTLAHWKPSLQRGMHPSLEQRLDLWILPWMPHLDHPAILPNLLADCKRKLKSSLSYLQRKIGKDDDFEFLRVSTDTVKPWARVYDQKALQRLVSEYMTPYLGRALAKERIHRRASEQDWASVRLAFELHYLGLLSDIEFLSVLEAELLPRWAAKVNDMLVADGKISVAEAATNYCLWKSEVMLNPRAKSISATRSNKLLRDDLRICAIFHTVLRMIQLAQQSNMDALEDLYPSSTNYHVVSARRTKERQSQVQDDFVRMESRSTSEVEARLRLRRRQGDTPSFRDVVEEFANERGILFQPRMGAKALKDGKQVFLFGDIHIYIEGDVIYSSQKASWRPTSLDQLIELSAGKA